MTSWGCVSPRTTFLSIVVLPLLLIMFYFILENLGSSTGSKTSNYKDVQYHTLEATSQKDQPITWQRRLLTIWDNTPGMITLFIGVSAELMMTEAVATTVVFPKAPFSPREHYLYYFFVFAIGVLIGRSYAFLAFLIAPNLNVLVEKTWVLSAFLMVNLLLCVLNSWYRFIPNVGIMLALMFVHGVAAGAMYMNSFTMAGRSEHDARLKEISRAFTTLGSGTGMLAAGLMGLYVESTLREHCFHETGSMELCLTRSMFNATTQCPS